MSNPSAVRLEHAREAVTRYRAAAARAGVTLSPATRRLLADLWKITQPAIPEQVPGGPTIPKSPMRFHAGADQDETPVPAEPVAGPDCGTPRGYRQHRKAGTEACQACKDAVAAEARERRAARKAAEAA